MSNTPDFIVRPVWFGPTYVIAYRTAAEGIAAKGRAPDAWSVFCSEPDGDPSVYNIRVDYPTEEEAVNAAADQNSGTEIPSALQNDEFISDTEEATVQRWYLTVADDCVIDPHTSMCGRFTVDPEETYGLGPRSVAILDKANRCEDATRLPAYKVAHRRDSDTMAECLRLGARARRGAEISATQAHQFTHLKHVMWATA